MGADFEFINETTSEVYDPKQHNDWYYLWRNIDRGEMRHLKNVILLIIKINNWRISDRIKITSGIETYYFENNALFELGIELECNNACKWQTACPVCSQF